MRKVADVINVTNRKSVFVIRRFPATDSVFFGARDGRNNEICNQEV